MHQFNHNYFKTIDTEEKAYILGFLYADGYNSDKQVVITQLEQDVDILEKINKALNANNQIKRKLQSTNNKTVCQLCYSSIDMCTDLTNLGCFRNKSLACTFPTFLDKSLIRHFIRGYFDGDGCVWIGKRKIMTVKDKTRPSGFRERIVQNVKFTITGNMTFINSLQDELVQMLGFKKTKLNFSKAKNANNSTCDKVCTMEYSGRKQMQSFYNYMYEGASIWGNRKRLKFEEICAFEEKSSKDTQLIAGTPEMVISSQASDIEEGSSTIPEMGVESSDSKCQALNDTKVGEDEDIVSSVVK